LPKCTGYSAVYRPAHLEQDIAPTELRRVWRAAADSLANAENIFVSGYSLPDTDAFFRDLYALGTIGHARLKRFWVFDPSNTGEVEARFRKLLGQGAAPRFELFKSQFSGMFPQIRPAFGLTTN